MTYQLVLKQVLQHREEQAEAARRKSETSSFSQTSTIIADAGIKVERVSIPNFKEKVSGIEVVRRSIDTEVQEKDPLKDIGLTLKDVNPFPTILTLLARPNNLTILFASGRCFLFSITFQNRFSYYEVVLPPKQDLTTRSHTPFPIHAHGHCPMIIITIHCKSASSCLRLVLVRVVALSKLNPIT